MLYTFFVNVSEGFSDQEVLVLWMCTFMLREGVVSFDGVSKITSNW
jgi:hypothetical protein